MVELRHRIERFGGGPFVVLLEQKNQLTGEWIQVPIHDPVYIISEDYPNWPILRDRD